MAAVIDPGKMIVSSPEIRGGRPRVAGTGMTVMRIAGWRQLGLSPEEIADQIGLSVGQVYAALTYIMPIGKSLMRTSQPKPPCTTAWRKSSGGTRDNPNPHNREHFALL